MTKAEICETKQGPLKIWMEHSNFPLQGRGDTKTPIALLGSVPSIYTEVLVITQESQFGHTMKQAAHFHGS